MLRNLTLLSFVFLGTICFAQEVISSQGDSYSNGNASLDFTIGEVIINTETDGNNIITQGFHQSKWNFLGVDNHEHDFTASVFPNPMDNKLNIKAEEFKDVSFKLFDATGKVVIENKLNGVQSSIDVNDLAPTSYSLVLFNENNEPIKTFKLIKTQ